MERLTLPSDFVGNYDNAIHCSNLTGLYSEDEVFKCDINFFRDIPNALKTTQGGSTYININSNPYYAVSNIGSNTSIQDGCVVLPYLINSTITGPLNTLYIPDSVKYIPYANNFGYLCTTLDIEGNEDLYVGSVGAGYAVDVKSIIQSINVSQADIISSASFNPCYVDPADVQGTTLPIQSVYLNARVIGEGVSSLSFTGRTNYYLNNLSRVNIGPDVEEVRVD